MAHSFASAAAPLISALTAPTNSLIAAKEMAAEQFLASRSAGSRFRAHGFSPKPRDNVMAVGIGPRLVASAKSDEPCVRLYVERKIPPEMLSPKWALPREIGGVPVEVIESGRFSAFEETPHRQRLRPAQPGCSIGVRFPEDEYLIIGTLGAVVSANGTSYVLSNNHVLAGENRLDLGTEIFQPAHLDHPEPEPIARLSKFVELTPDRPNTMDCAIAEILQPGFVDPIFLPTVGQLAAAAAGTPTQGLAVEKIGRSTGWTTGHIFDLNFDAEVEYGSGTFLFQNQLLVQGDRQGWSRLLRRPWTPFSEPGDSGAVVVDRTGKIAVGLLLGGSDKDLSIVSPIGGVLSALGVAIVV